MGRPRPDTLELPLAIHGRCLPVELGMEAHAQQPPKMPLLRSTNAANASHVDSSRALTVHFCSTTDPHFTGARSRGPVSIDQSCGKSTSPTTKSMAARTANADTIKTIRTDDERSC